VLSIEELLKDLTESQRQAATHVDGPLLIIAGAGSGKTRVLTRRVAYLMSNGINPASILAITFTNKAAGEMKERIGKLFGRKLHDIGRLDQQNPLICTFHSLCVRILRHYGSRFGLASSFTIYDSLDQSKLIKEALKSLDISSSNFPPAQIHSAISHLKNQLVTPQDFAASASGFYDKNVARVYGRYQKLLESNNALDFDDLLMKTVHGLRDHPDVLNELQDRFQYLLIDEYQDTNRAQYVLAHALAMKYRNICVVGDPDQSIYAWRGADIQNILDFEKDYPDAKVVRLEQNYRSTKTILAIASKLISYNTQRKEKGLWTNNDTGEKATFYICRTEEDEANTIIEELKKEHKQGRPWSEMAIFYRMNSLSRVLEEKLVSGRIPYQIARGTAFYDRKEIKDLLSYLRVLVNPQDEVSLERIINTPPRGIGDESIRKIRTWGVSQGLGLWHALTRAEEIPDLSTRVIKSVQAFHRMMARLSEEASKVQNVSTEAVAEDMFAGPPDVGMVQGIMQEVFEQSGMRAVLEKSADPDKPELANVKELINSAAEYDRENPQGRLEDYLAQISLMSDVDQVRDGGGALTLMTLHAAKGLEFPVVAMIGMEEGILPHARARTDPQQMEEERRLCFVGITRAQTRLILSRAFTRTIMGRRERTIPSPFLNEMPVEMIEVEDRTMIDDESTGLNDNYTSHFRPGQIVRHAVFGLGRICNISSMGRHTRVVVEFQKTGRKTLILEYAQLETLP
jgi:DNA helicase-2/ATP-dependent DNA helicase PcrA